MSSHHAQPKQLERIRISFAAKGEVDIENRVIRNAILCQVGKAKGHGIEANLRTLEKLLSLAPKGVDSYWNHNWDNLGLWLGQYKDLRIEGDKQLKGDLHVDELADQSPNFAQPVGKYLLSLVKKDPTKAMASVVCVIEKYYQIDEYGNDVRVWYYDADWNWISANSKMPVFFDPKTFESCDIVHKGALTDSMFSEKKDKEAVLDGHGIHQFIQNMEENVKATELNEAQKKAAFTQFLEWIGFSKPSTGGIVPPATDETTTLKAENAELQRQFDASKTERTNLQTQLSAALAANTTHETTIAELKATIEKLEKVGGAASGVQASQTGQSNSDTVELKDHPAQIKFSNYLQTLS